MIEIKKIHTENDKDVETFIQLPFRLYEDHPYWVPPLRSEMKQILNKKQHPFYDHSQADFFVALEENQALGRISAIFNHKYNQFNNSNTAFFYHFECVDEQHVADALFQAAFRWSRDRGAEDIFGPKGLLQGDGTGLLIEGFDYPPAMGIPYNYPYYQILLEKAGFKKSSDYFSGYLKSSAELPEQVYRVADKVKERKGFWVKDFQSKAQLLEEATEIRDVYNAAFAGGEGFRPITEEEMEVIAQQMLTIADPRLIKLVYKDETIIGFLFAYPNIWRGLQKSRGKLWPLGWFHIWRDMRTTDWVDVNGMGILPEHQGWGATAVLYVELEKTIREFGFKHTETVQVREDNIESMGEHRLLGVNWYKTHRVYSRDL